MTAYTCGQAISQMPKLANRSEHTLSARGSPRDISDFIYLYNSLCRYYLLVGNKWSYLRHYEMADTQPLEAK